MNGAGIEATAVLASDFRTEIDADDRIFDEALSFFDELSVLPEAAVCAPVATAMHDPTEGGVLGGLVEMARASNVNVVLDGDSVPIRPATRELCGAMDLDPLRVLGSGALLVTVSANDAGTPSRLSNGRELRRPISATSRRSPATLRRSSTTTSATPARFVTGCTFSGNEQSSEV